MRSEASPARRVHSNESVDAFAGGNSGGENRPASPLERILAHCRPLRLLDGDLVPPVAFCRVEEGRIGLGLDGVGPRVVHLLGPGAWFRVEAPPRRLIRRAVGAARLVFIENTELEAALPDDVAVVKLAMLEVERDRILALTAALLVADPLQRLAMRLAALCTDVGATHLDLTQGELAVMAALSRHTVNRALARLEADGIVVNRYRRIEVRDLAALHAVAERKPGRGRRPDADG